MPTDEDDEDAILDDGPNQIRILPHPNAGSLRDIESTPEPFDPPALVSDDDPAEDEEDDEPAAKKKPVRRVHQTVKKESPVAKEKNEKTPAREEPPIDLILELVNNEITEVKFNIRRKMPGPGWATLKNSIRIPPKNLSDLRDPLFALAGGGHYEIKVFDIESGRQILPTWYERIEGQPRLVPPNLTLVWNEQAQKLEVSSFDNAMGANIGGTSSYGAPSGFGAPGQSMGQILRGPPPGMPGAPGQPGQPQDLYQLAMQQLPRPSYVNGQIQPPPEGLLPKWVANYAPQQQWDMLVNDRIRVLEEQVRQGGGGVGDMANQWIHHEIRRQSDLREEKAHLGASLESIRSQMQARLEAVEEARQRAEKELERERAKNELAAIEGKLKAIELASTARKDLDFVGLASAIGPTIAAYMKMQSDNAKIEREAQMALMKSEREAQMQMMIALTAKKEDTLLPTITAVAPLLAPVLVQWIQNGGPQARAEVQSLQHEQQMMALKMMADLVASMAPAEESWQEKALQIAMAVFGNMQNRPALPPPQQRTLPPSPQQRQAAAQQQAAPPQPGQQSQAQETVPADNGGARPLTLLEKMYQQDPNAAQAVQMIYAQLPPELGFHSHEWMTILFNVHVRMMPGELAPIVVNHLVNCQNFGSLPTPLVNVFENPQPSLESVFNILPIAQQDPAYVAQLVEAVISEIASMNESDDEGDEDDEDDEGDEGEEDNAHDNGATIIDSERVIVTPAPAAVRSA